MEMITPNLIKQMEVIVAILVEIKTNLNKKKDVEL